MNNVDEAIGIYNGLKRNKDVIANIYNDFFFKFADTLISAYQQEKEKRKEIEEINEGFIFTYNEEMDKREKLEKELKEEKEKREKAEKEIQELKAERDFIQKEHIRELKDLNDAWCKEVE